MVGFNQQPVQWVTGLSGNLTPDPEPHQDGDNDDGQRGRPRHGVRFGEGQRTKQPPFLPLKSKDGNEGQGDNQQADKQRGANLDRGVGDHLPARGVINLLSRMLVIPLFEPFVRVFNHDDGGIHHRPDGNGNASQRHNVGVQPLEMHDDKGNTQAKRQRDNRDQRRANVPQEQCADDGHHDKLFEQLGTQVVDCPIDELAAIVGGHNLNAFRQAGLQRLQLIFHRRDDFTRIFTRTQDHHAARNFPLPV